MTNVADRQNRVQKRSASPQLALEETDVKFIMACDESGAKGYADQDEQYPGQVGVFAGLLVPETILLKTEQALEAAIAPHRGSDGKLHISDLSPPNQAALRVGIFDVVGALHLPCFWYAIHVAGYHAHHLTMVKLLEDSSKEARLLSNRVKTRAPRENLGSLHLELFRGLYGHMLAFIEERAPGEVDIEARTDRVDTPIAKGFRREAEKLLETSRESVVTGFDTITKQVVKRKLHFQTTIPPELQIQTKVKSLNIRSVSDADPIVVAADVLANSLYHHFRSRSGNELYHELNRPKAVATHPLARSLDTFWNWGGGDLVGDRLYRHPKAPPVAEISQSEN